MFNVSTVYKEQKQIGTYCYNEIIRLVPVIAYISAAGKSTKKPQKVL